MVAACLYLARGEDELRVAGALLGEPVALARCTHVPLEVPAGCELVLEGELDLDETVEEGPVSEFHGGYERYGRAATATFQPPHAASRCRLPGHPAGLPSRARAARRRRDRRGPRADACADACRPCTPSRCPRAAPGAWRRSSRSARTSRQDARSVALAALRGRQPRQARDGRR